MNQLLADEGLLKERISSTPPPLIPYLRNTEDISPKIFYEKNGSIWINIESMVQNSLVVSEIQKWQAIKYNFHPVKKIQDHIINYPIKLDTSSADILSLSIQK